MRISVPSYYSAFSCIGSVCKHNCCIGWEIDIDEETASYYRRMKGKLGDKLQKCMGKENGVSFFKLDGAERCPFLDDNNLCEIICTLGEESLCRICADHPRYRNFFSDRTEIGIGLACEEACRCILGGEDMPHIVTCEDDGKREALLPAERAVLSLREKLFAALKEHEKPMRERMAEILRLADAHFPAMQNTDWADFLHTTERLDPAFQKNIKDLCRTEKTGEIPPVLQEKLMFYFLHRHLADAAEDGRVRERVLFAAVSTYLIGEMWRGNEKKDREAFSEIARAYSAEIEYDADNMEKFFNLFADPKDKG